MKRSWSMATAKAYIDQCDKAFARGETKHRGLKYWSARDYMDKVHREDQHAREQQVMAEAIKALKGDK
jgi:hypothetical protein